jgi:hypothetical protein
MASGPHETVGNLEQVDEICWRCSEIKDQHTHTQWMDIPAR